MTEQNTEVAERPEPTLLGRVVLDIMRRRNLADASELGLDRLDLKALRRNFDGERTRPPALAGQEHSRRN